MVGGNPEVLLMDPKKIISRFQKLTQLLHRSEVGGKLTQLYHKCEASGTESVGNSPNFSMRVN